MVRMRIALALMGLLLAARAQAAQAPATGGPQEPMVVTTGEGRVQAAPDRAWITVSAESRAPSPLEAQRRNVELMRPVRDALRAAKVADDAIRTVGYDVQQEFDFVNGKRLPKGYLARNAIEIRVDDVTRVGELLETVVKQGATSVSGLRWDLKDEARLEREAMRSAVANARLKAEAAAAGAGRTLDRLVRIEEEGAQSQPPPRPAFRSAQLNAVAADAAPPVSEGQIEVRSQVTVTFTLK